MAAQKSRSAVRSFRVGKVTAYLRGRIWYLRYLERGKRVQTRAGEDREAVRQLAAEINAQLETGAPSALSFEPVPLAELRQRWLDHHEHVRRSSVSTIRRYRSATEHLMQFATEVEPIRLASDLRPRQAEAFVRYLRSLQVAPNGHRRAKKRQLRDAGIKFILETCGSLFNYAGRHRHLPPYVENPFRTIEVSRIPVEDAREVVPLDAAQQRQFFEACDDWQFPMFLTLLLTGLRPGELVHLLLPNDLDLDAGWLRVRNKSRLGWQVKTRNERDVPLVPVLVEILKLMLGQRRMGPVFQQRRCHLQFVPPLAERTQSQAEQELVQRVIDLEHSRGANLSRFDRLGVARTVWRDYGALKEDWIRCEFKRITKQIGIPTVTAPKTLRHTFATMLQECCVDPLVRNELMGHAPAASGLGMTAIYTHTKPETKQRQLIQAITTQPILEVASTWLQKR